MSVLQHDWKVLYFYVFENLLSLKKNCIQKISKQVKSSICEGKNMEVNEYISVTMETFPSRFFLKASL
jgi:hypothetical protein